MNKYTKNDCVNEIIRLLNIMLFGKVDKDEEKNIKSHLKNCVIKMGEIEHENIIKRQQRAADRERNKLGLNKLEGRNE